MIIGMPQIEDHAGCWILESRLERKFSWAMITGRAQMEDKNGWWRFKCCLERKFWWAIIVGLQYINDVDMIFPTEMCILYCSFNFLGDDPISWRFLDGSTNMEWAKIMHNMFIEWEKSISIPKFVVGDNLICLLSKGIFSFNLVLK